MLKPFVLQQKFNITYFCFWNHSNFLVIVTYCRVTLRTISFFWFPIFHNFQVFDVIVVNIFNHVFLFKKRIVLAAVQQNGVCFTICLEELKKDRELSSIARQSGYRNWNFNYLFTPRFPPRRLFLSLVLTNKKRNDFIDKNFRYCTW